MTIYTCPKTNRPCESTGCFEGSMCRDLPLHLSVQEDWTNEALEEGPEEIEFPSPAPTQQGDISAMSELIEKLKVKQGMWQRDTAEHKHRRATYQVAIIVATSLLAKEREQIIDAYDAGYEPMNDGKAGDSYFKNHYSNTKP